MKLFGYDVDDGEERERPRTLREATLLVTAAELRAIAGFLVRCADEMDEPGERFGHQTVGGFLITWQAFMAPDASSFQIPQLSPNTAAWLPWPEPRGLEGTSSSSIATG